MNTFAENLAALPSVAHIAQLELHDADGHCIAVIENRPGSAGSVAVYHAVSRPDGVLDRTAAEQALALYAEHTADAHAFPGKHPNIDRLLALIAEGSSLRVRVVETGG
jgi:hypothetical protein